GKLWLSCLGLGSCSLREKQTDFGLKVFSQLAQGSVHQNLVFSPYGVTSVMAMAQLGANGNTLKALTTTLGFSLHGEWLKQSMSKTLLLGDWKLQPGVAREIKDPHNTGPVAEAPRWIISTST
uniref:Serpin domain-containing protein n=1 Tax=Nothobranchius furzeri TaxID=105023 RepID=A0A8C6PSH9_NOTFU